MADAKARSGFAPVVVAGLAAAALTSVASSKPWVRLDVPARLMPGVPDSDRAADMPLALALSLVVLAGWGAVLVSRGAVRRVCASLALLAALGVLACAAAAPFVLPGDLRHGLGMTGDAGPTTVTAWFVTAAVAGLVSVASLAVASVRLPQWPTMSSRYDAPTARPSGPHETDLWKALDEGRDPTEAEGPPAP
jgi:hypothetical protein